MSLITEVRQLIEQSRCAVNGRKTLQYVELKSNVPLKHFYHTISHVSSSCALRKNKVLVCCWLFYKPCINVYTWDLSAYKFAGCENHRHLCNYST